MRLSIKLYDMKKKYVFWAKYFYLLTFKNVKLIK